MAKGGQQVDNGSRKEIVATDSQQAHHQTRKRAAPSFYFLSENIRMLAYHFVKHITTDFNGRQYPCKNGKKLDSVYLWVVL